MIDSLWQFRKLVVFVKRKTVRVWASINEWPINKRDNERRRRRRRRRLFHDVGESSFHGGWKYEAGRCSIADASKAKYANDDDGTFHNISRVCRRQLISIISWRCWRRFYWPVTSHFAASIFIWPVTCLINGILPPPPQARYTATTPTTIPCVLLQISQKLSSNNATLVGC